MEKKVDMYNPTRHFNEKKDEYTEKINTVLNHGLFINGPEVSKLEEELGKYVGAKALGVSSGTDALLIALMALDVQPGDEVITVPFTWISTAEVIKLLGATPIFCDINPNTFNMDPTLLRKAITERTKVIMPVSIFGQMYDVDEINKIVKEYEEKYNRKIYVIEDAAQSFGAINKKGISCGVSDIGCTSFFPSKPLGCFGDGGMCFTNDDKLFEKMKAIRTHGCKKRYVYECVGINGRLDTLQAAILLAKLPYMNDQFEKRSENAEYYNKAFSDLPFDTPKIHKDNIRHVYAQYTITLKDEETRDRLNDYLNKNKIGSAVFYPVCLHLVPAITEDYFPGSMPVSESLATRVLSLPCYPELTEEEREKTVEVMTKFFTEGR